MTIIIIIINVMEHQEHVQTEKERKRVSPCQTKLQPSLNFQNKHIK